MALSDKEFSDYAGIKAPAPDVTPPPAYSKATSTTFGRETAWRRRSGMGISKQAFGSFLSFDDSTGPTVPSSDKGASFGKA